jgi:hypothetical protein
LFGLFLGYGFDLLEEYRDNNYRLSIEKDLLLDKIDTYEKLVVFMRNKYRKLEEEFKSFKSNHCVCSKTKLPYYR